MPLVKLPDGRIARYPDGMPREEIKAHISSKFPDAAISKPQNSGPMVSVGGRQIPVAEYQAMPEFQRQQLQDQVAESGTHSDTLDNKGSALDTAMQGLTFGFADEMRGVAQGGIAAAKGGDYGQAYKQSVEGTRQDLDDYRRREPVKAVVSEIGGAVLPAVLSGGAAVASKAAPLATRVLRGAGAGALQGGAYGIGADEGGIADRIDGGAIGALTGGALGAAAPAIGNKAAKIAQRFKQNRALNSAAKSAPQMGELKTQASNLFKQADQDNPVISSEAFGRLYQNIEDATKKFRPNANLDPKSSGALQVLSDTLEQVTDPTNNVLPDLKDIHLIRQAAQKAATSGEGRDSAIANIMVDRVDDFVKTLKQGDVAGGADPGQATNALIKGISTWSKANKAGIIEDAIDAAQNQASGVENGLRVQFRKILNNKKLRSKFNSAEIAAIEEVVQGSTAANAMKLIGKFGFGSGNSSNMLGGSIGFGAASMTPLGPLGGVIATTGASGARKASEKLTERAARRAAGAVASDGLKVIPQIDPNKVGIVERGVRRLTAPIAGQVSNVNR